MKTHLNKLVAVLALGVALLVNASAQTAVEAKPPGEAPHNTHVSIDSKTPDVAQKMRDQIETVDAYNALKKENAELKAQAAMLPQYQQQNQYLSVLAERNELAVRVVQRELADAQAAVARLQNDLAAAKADATKAREQLLGLEGKK